MNDVLCFKMLSKNKSHVKTDARLEIIITINTIFSNILYQCIVTERHKCIVYKPCILKYLLRPSNNNMEHFTRT